MGGSKNSPDKEAPEPASKHGKTKQKLKPPVYLEEIEKICYPFEKLPQKKVTLQSDANSILDGSDILDDNNRAVDKQRR